MNHIRIGLLGAMACVVLGLTAGCGSDDSDSVAMRPCPDVCKEAQAGSCTSVKGDCSDFCGALERQAPPAKCETQRTNYLKCLSGGPVCAQGCSSTDNALSNCMLQYCMQHTTEPDCKTLIASF